MKMEISRDAAVEFLLRESSVLWSQSAAETIVDSMLEYGAEVFCVEEINANYCEFEDAFEWIEAYTGKPWEPSLLNHIDIEPNRDDSDYDLEVKIHDYIRGKHELFICRYSIVVSTGVWVSSKHERGVM